MLTGAQIRAARGLLNMSVAELASRTGLAVNTIRRAEATNEEAPITQANIKLLTATLREAGVSFIEAGTMGPGVQLTNALPLPTQRRRKTRESPR